MVIRLFQVTLLTIALSFDAFSISIQWLPSASDSLLGVASSIDSSLKHRVVRSLFESSILSVRRNHYRDVKIKLYNTSSPMYAIAFLYSKTLLRFHAVRVDMNADGEVERIHRDYHLSSHDFFVTPEGNTLCENPNLEAMLFLPQYVNHVGEKPCAKLATESFDNQQYCRMLKAFNEYYSSGKSVALLGNEATVSAFNRFISCPRLRFYFSLSGEYVDPEKVPAGQAFEAYDPTELSSTVEPNISSADFNSNASPSLETTVVAGCHLFSNDTPMGFCPLVVHSTRLHNIKYYSSGASSLDVPGAEATYACFLERYFKSGDFLKSVHTCAQQNDPWIKNNDSHLLYVSNSTGEMIKVNGVDLQADDTMAVSHHHAGSIKIVDHSGQRCTMQLGTAQNERVDTVNQGFFDVTMSLGSQNSSVCNITNLLSALPVAELPNTDGSGVVYGAYSRQRSFKSQCAVMQSAFDLAVNDVSHGQCQSSSLTFDLKGFFHGRSYSAISLAASAAGQRPDYVLFNHVIVPAKCMSRNSCQMGGIPLGRAGYFYVGDWQFQLMHVKGLASGCQLHLDNREVYSDTTGSTVVVKLQYVQKHH